MVECHQILLKTFVDVDANLEEPDINGINVFECRTQLLDALLEESYGVRRQNFDSKDPMAIRIVTNGPAVEGEFRHCEWARGSLI